MKIWCWVLGVHFIGYGLHGYLTEDPTDCYFLGVFVGLCSVAGRYFYDWFDLRFGREK